MLDDELTLLDGTDVISLAEVIKITNGQLYPWDLRELLRHETTLQGQEYFNRAHALSLIAALR